ncbi:heavy-metal-associated domain-containing protein [Mariniflexile jejuense]|uniref:Heavy-metal-associated domain-containing protein n=1 Tax=Mariniflexile jejuense TaxID=1173582 RepID=A0ABW3JP79_9FLAO
MNTILVIQNLKCHGCANTITNKLSNLEGISDIVVNNETDSVSFNYENEACLLEAKTLLHNLGYPVNGEKNALTTKAKSFVSCAIGRMNG